MLTTYGKLKEKSKAETQRKSTEIRKLSSSKVSFTTARNLTTNSLNLAITNEEGVSEVELKMNQFSILDKIVFHKGVSDLIYAYLTKEALAHLKSQQRVVKLETQLKQEKETNKAWNMQVKLSTDQVAELTTQDALQHPLASKHPMATEHAILPAKSLATIHAYKKKIKTPMKYIHLPP